MGRIANVGTSRVPPDTLWLCRPAPLNDKKVCEVRSKNTPQVGKKKLLLLGFEVYSFILFINNFLIINQ